MYHNSVVSLAAASSSDHLSALSEVRDFATTDMGRGGPQRWTYRVLPEPELSNRLRAMSNAFSKSTVDGVSLQPHLSHEYRNQDRALTEVWATPAGPWTFNAIFDGSIPLQT
jgi:pyruvate dehydrogenase phosphatase